MRNDYLYFKSDAVVFASQSSQQKKKVKNAKLSNIEASLSIQFLWLNIVTQNYNLTTFIN